MMRECINDKRPTRSEAERAVIAEATEKMGAAWVVKTLAKLEGHRGRLPQSVKLGDRHQGVVSERKAKIVALLDKSPGISRGEISAAISGCTDNDFANLRMSGRIHAKWEKRRWCYFAGPAEAAE